MQKYILIDNETSEGIDVYMNVGAHSKRYFNSISEARNSNCHGTYKDRIKYGIGIVNIHEGMINVDEANEEEIEKHKAEIELDRLIEKEMDDKGVTSDWDRAEYSYRYKMSKIISDAGIEISEEFKRFLKENKITKK